MFAALPALSAALKLIEALAPLAALILIRLYGQGQNRAGARQQAAATTAATLGVETAIAQAEAASPQTRQAVVDQLNQGSF